MKKQVSLLAFVASSVVLLSGCGGGTDVEAEYLYNTYISTNPSTWNVHTWETSDESYVMGFCEMGFYDMVFDNAENPQAYEFFPEMASAFPVQVSTDDLTDAEIDYFIDAGVGNPSAGMVWDIPLNTAAKWEDGTAITASDYVTSMGYMLSPDYANYRADSYYNGDLVLINAENYYKQGRQTIEPAYDYVNKSTGAVENDTGYWYINLGLDTPYFNSVFTGESGTGNFYSVLNNRSSTASNATELAAERITAGVAYYLHAFVYTEGSEALENSEDREDWESLNTEGFRPDSVSSTMFENDHTYIDVTDFDNLEVYTVSERNQSSWEIGVDTDRYTWSDLRSDLNTFVRGINGPSATWAYKLPLFTEITNEIEGDPLTIEDVGIVAKDDYTLRFYLTKVITSLNLRFSLTGNWLVKNDLYEALSFSTGVGNSKGTRYATASVDNYASYGPYKLTYYESGNRMVMERNDQWYGYTDGQHEGQFQMEAIVTRVITEHATALNEFMAGRLDDIDLTADDMKTYGNSSRRTTTYESYTQKLSFNTNRSKLMEREAGSSTINKTILANDNFRKGLSLSIDRENFASKTTGGSKAFTGLLNDLYIADNSDGTTYRNTEQGKSVYNAVYSHMGGDEIGEEIALPESANGYNHDLAVEYMKAGIREELQSTVDGHLAAGDTIDIEFRVYDATSDTTIDMYNFINEAWTGVFTEAKTELVGEGVSDASSLSFYLHTVTDQDYYDSATGGNYDMIFSIWGGATINPYGIMQVYCDSTFSNCCEYGFKGSQSLVDLEIDSDGDGVMETRTFDGWYNYMANDLSEAQYGDDPAEMSEADYQGWLRVHNQRLNILAGLEAGILNRFEAVPIVARGSSSLLSFKCEYGSQTYISLVGYGGVRYMKFNYTVSQWEQEVANAGGNLSTLYATR